MTSIFMKEWMAGGRSPFFLPISTVCNCNCLFCSNKYNSFDSLYGLFRDVEDIKHQLSLMPIHAQPIDLSCILPGRLPEGEAFLHPRFFEILTIIRKKFPLNRLTFFSNGLILDRAFMEMLSRFRPVTIALSIHTLEPDIWARIYNKSISEAERALKACDLINEYGLSLKGSVVPVPELCGWDGIERVVSFLQAHQAD